MPLIAALSDGFEISGGAGEGTRMCVRLSFDPPDPDASNGHAETPDETAIALAAGEMVRPVLARVIGALASRAEFSLDRLADTVLLGDAVSYHGAEDFTQGRVGISIKATEGAMAITIGPLVDGGGERLLGAMDLPGGERGSLRKLASMEVTSAREQAGQAPSTSRSRSSARGSRFRRLVPGLLADLFAEAVERRAQYSGDVHLRDADPLGDLTLG